MDEKEEKEISIRADFHAETKWGHKEFSSERSKKATMFECFFDYKEGALDQDPISRKKRTEEILKIIEGYIEFYKDENKHPHTRITLEDITTVIEALP